MVGAARLVPAKLLPINIVPLPETIHVSLIHGRFWSNENRLWLSLIAYNLGNLWRRLVLPKTGGRLIKHARDYC
jgi:hypothetical protein